MAVKICTGVLLAVIVISTIVLDVTVDKHKYRLAHAFFRTISLMATAADMHADDPGARWFSVFASVLRLLGAALIAAFTAIVTNYLLRARLAPGMVGMKNQFNVGYIHCEGAPVRA